MYDVTRRLVRLFEKGRSAIFNEMFEALRQFMLVVVVIANLTQTVVKN